MEKVNQVSVRAWFAALLISVPVGWSFATKSDPVNPPRNFAFWLIFILLAFVLVNYLDNAGTPAAQTELTYSELLTRIDQGQVADVSLRGQQATGTLSDGRTFLTQVPESSSLVQRLENAKVKLTALPEEGPSPILNLLFVWLPLIMLLFFGWLVYRQMQSGSGRALGFGKSRARLLNEKSGRVTFEDVAGIEEAKQELQEVVEFLKDPHKFQRLGGKIPKGCLLVGPPGTGKTLLARAIAGEANAPFFTISGSDFVEMFVGVGASRVRDMFEQAKKHAPCIVFIDEIDAVGRHRGAGLGGGNDEREQTLNQLLVEMDGFESTEGVILIAATNRPDVLDPALLRPGRFDRQIVVPNPDVNGREQILKVHMRKTPLAPDVDARVIARGTPGFSGAELANLVNEAALMAARLGRRVVTMAEFEAAKDRVMMGAERRSMVMTEDEKLATAYHEAGHAIVNMAVPECDPLHKVTIIPRGRALGVTFSLPERDHLSHSKNWLTSKIAMCFGGRVAEQLIYGEHHLNTGAASDLHQATSLARRMVTEWGMSEKLGPLRYSENEEEIFLGHSVTQRKNISDATARLIDEEIRRIVEGGERQAREILSARVEELHLLAKALMEYETLSGEEAAAVIRGEPIRVAPQTPASKPRASVPQSGITPGGLPGAGGLSPSPAG